MGFSLKKALGSVGGAVAGAFLGGPGGAAVGSSIGSSLFGDSAKDSYKYQLKNNIALWNMNNAYNTPKAQMERFKEAGLNPNLIYGQTNTASPISTANYDVNNSEGQLGFENSQKILGNYLALSNLGIQKDLSSAQVRNIDNSIDMSKQNLELAKGRLRLDRDRLNLDRDMANAGIIGQYIGRERGGRLMQYLEDLIMNSDFLNNVAH